MFVDPKITLTQRVTDPAGTIRKARVLLDQHLRQDAAYNRQVSKSLYFIGPDVTCQITHEFSQTYIALDQKFAPTSQPQSPHKTPQFLSIMMGNFNAQGTVPQGTYGFQNLAAWCSNDGSTWAPKSLGNTLYAALQYDMCWLTRINQNQVFIVGQLPPFPSPYAASWSLFSLLGLALSTPQNLPEVDSQIVALTGVAAYVGETVVCMAVRNAAENDYLVWFDYTKGQYLYVLPIADLVPNIPVADNSYLAAALAAITRGTTSNYAQVVVALPVQGGVAAWTVDVNTSSFQYIVTLPTNYVSANQLIGMAAGTNGQVAIAYPSAASAGSSVQNGTNYWVLSPLQNTGYATLNFPAVGQSLGYTPLGWYANFSSQPGDVYFFSSTALLGTASRSVSSPYIDIKAAPAAALDTVAGDMYQVSSQTAGQPRGIPPYANQHSPAYALGWVDFVFYSFYLGPDFAPWLNLY